MYLRAFLYNYQFPKTNNHNFDNNLLTRLEKEGIDSLYKELINIDPDIKEKVHKNNHKRVLRNLEIYYQSGQKPTHAKQQNNILRKDVNIIGLTAERSLIYERINSRVLDMIQNDLIGEVKSLIKSYPEESYAFQALGYKEVIAHLNGSYDHKEMIELIQRKTRNFAKCRYAYNQRTHGWTLFC